MRAQGEAFAASQREMADIQMMQSTVAAQTSALTSMNDALNERIKKAGESMKSATQG
jgi:predicted  nucleic acid-binding Zn-ribbon protein